ncbi:MAG TPA: hypothetical protein VE225_05410, partial [Rubrobacteraceae bacterium]|nr:hypothetical protein [Rubrobacteraceae bacterium]
MAPRWAGPNNPVLATRRGWRRGSSSGAAGLERHTVRETRGTAESLGNLRDVARPVLMRPE